MGAGPVSIHNAAEARAKSRGHHDPGMIFANIAGGHHAVRVTAPAAEKACATWKSFHVNKISFFLDVAPKERPQQGGE